MSELSSRYSRALVTGARCGLGKAFATRLIKEGIEVWGTSRKPHAFRGLDGITSVLIDLDREKDLSQWYTDLDDRAGGFDLLINNAGYGTFGKFGDHGDEDIDSQLRVLLIAPMQIALGAMKCMRSRNRGCIVNVSSLAGSLWIPFSSAYNTGKAGLSAFSQSLMLEAPKDPPWIIDFCLGDYRTRFNRSVVRRGEQSEKLQKVWRRLEQNTRSAPSPERAAKDLIFGLKRFQHCTLLSGSFFQGILARLGVRLVPTRFKRMLLRRYFHLP